MQQQMIHAGPKRRGIPGRRLAGLLLALLALARCAAASPPPDGSTTALPRSSATDSSATSTPPPSASSAAPTPQSLASLIHPLVPSWRPSSTTVVVTESVAGGAVRVVAVPVSSGAATALVEIRSAGGLMMNSDGSAVAVSLSTSPRTARIAVWNPASGASHWVTPADDLLATDPAWSADGRHIFFARSRVTPGGPPESLGIWRVLSDGTGEEQVMAPVRDVGLGITLRAVTPDGRGLVWGKTRTRGRLARRL